MFGFQENNVHELLKYEVSCAFQFLAAFFGRTKPHLLSFLNLNVMRKFLLGQQFEHGTADLLKTFVKKCSLSCSSVVSEL